MRKPGLRMASLALLALLGFSLFAVFYLDHRLIGDQLGLWSYISEQEHDRPFALWNPDASGGVPHALNPEYSYLDLSFFISALTGDILLRAFLTNALHVALFIVGMFLLSYHLTRRMDASLVGALAAAFSCGAAIRVIGNNPYFFGMAVMPFLFLSILRLLERPNYPHAFLAAAAGTYLILAGGIGVLLWLIFFMPFFFLAYFALFFEPTKARRQALFLGIALALFILFSLFKVWGAFMYAEDTTLRPETQPYEYFLQGTGLPKDFGGKLASIVVRYPATDFVGLWLGPIGLGLLLFLLPSWKRKHQLLFLVLFALSALVVFDTLATHLAHQIPYLNRTKDVVKSLIVLPMAFGVLSSFGYLNFESVARRTAGALTPFLAHLAAIAILAQFTVFFIISSQGMYSPDGEGLGPVLVSPDILQGAKTSQPSRISYLDFNGGSVQVRLAHHGLEVADWVHGNGYSLPFVTYKQIAAQGDTDKLLGLLNVKHIYSQSPLSRPSLRLVDSRQSEYLYENSAFIERYRLVPHAVLVYENPDAPQASYGLLNHPSFNASTTILLTMNSLAGIDTADFDAIVLAAQPSPADGAALSAYSGPLFTSEFNAQLNLSLFDALASLDGRASVLSSREGKDSLTLEIPSAGWISLSETFSVYEGWEAELSGTPLSLYRANGIMTAVRAPSAGTLELRYRPVAFTTGLPISLLSFAAASGLLLALYARKRKLAHKQRAV